MTTSANVIEYRIEKNGEIVGNFRKNLLCKFPDYSDLLKYQPLIQHTITPYGYDQDEEYWEDDTQNLENFLRGIARHNNILYNYFIKNNKNEI